MRCDCEHCPDEGVAFATITSQVYLCSWHSYWLQIPQQRSSLELTVEVSDD